MEAWQSPAECTGLENQRGFYPPEVQILSPPPIVYDLKLKGNRRLLKRHKVGIVASRVILPELTEAVVMAVLRLSQEKFLPMSGWHSPMEAEIHRTIIAQKKPHVHFEAKTFSSMSCAMGKDEVLLLTHCETTQNRITRASALERNRILCQMADILLIPWLDPKGKTHTIVSELCGEKPVYVFDGEYNDILVRSGARVFDEVAILKSMEN